MKSFKMQRNGISCDIVELSYADIVKLLLGRELQVWPRIIVRQPVAYEIFNLAAPPVEE